MAADMLKARNAIAELRTWQVGAELDDKAVAAIADLSETFEWLDESRQEAIKRAEAAEAALAEALGRQRGAAADEGPPGQ